jgi:RNA recognition motif-containing protein
VAREPAAPRRVRVDKLAAGTTSDQLKAYFGGVGRVSSAKVIEGRNHGFVTFEDAATASKAVSLNGSNIGGSAVEVSLDARARRAPREPAATEAGAGRRRAAADEEEREPRDVTNTTWVGGLDTEKATEE